ncbi:ATP-binding cassette domain-containing protein [Candidatus Berkiella aquae]|uniref:ABC transporter ATP-binding protein/permease n=2 Tax=Candidatus Berkiella aquae TaxID=295108 RepID=A0AAE3HZA8_9GAMM|nr:ABC transporter ATP-binding protein [Candidatus Berkiella aquae]MCS5712359.1 ABC transporter ATP-binding protein/permease [Candidatus Berkiella aquae]
MKVVRPFKWLISGQIFVAIVWAIDISLRPYLIKVILNTIADSPHEKVVENLWVPAGFYLFVSITVVIVFRYYDWVALKLFPGIKKMICMILMDRMMDHSHQTYQNQFAGGLSNKISDVMNGVSNIVRLFIDKFFSQTLALFIAVYTVWTVDIKFAFALLIWVILFLALSLGTAPHTRHLSDKAATARTTLMGHIVDIFSNMMSIRLFSTKNSEHGYLENMMDNYVSAEQKRDRFFMNVHALQGVSFVVFQALCLWWLIMGVKMQTTTAGDFALILSINIAMVDCLWIISQDVKEFAEHLGNVTQGLRIVTAPIEIPDKPNAKNIALSKGKIVFDNVRFQYNGMEPLFKNKSITINAGQKVGLVGFSGSGKTTFVNLILRLFDVTGGSIMIDGQDIRDLTQKSLRKAIAMIPQEPTLFNRTLLENIRYGKLNATEKEVMTAAQKAHAHDFIRLIPEKYQVMVGERGVKLSGGQRQRIAIARAILKNSPILILDEATSQLDSMTETLIQESLWYLMENKTCLVIAHRLSTLLHMDRIIVFERGKIVQDGTHDELMNQPGLYKSLWEAQIGGFLPADEDEESE